MPIYYPSNVQAAASFAALPNAAANPGMTARVSIGTGTALYYSDGTNWIPAGPIQLGGNTVAVGIAPTGTMGNNGALTSGTAFNATYSQGLYLYLPANTIQAGSAAGFYWTVMSSTTVGTVYNNTYTPGTLPTRPVSPTAFSTTGPGAYTGVTAETTAVSATIPGGSMGLNGRVQTEFSTSLTNNANSKNIRLKLGSTTMYTSTQASSLNARGIRVTINNKASQAMQFCSGTLNGGNTTANTFTYTATEDTSANSSVSITIQIATATDAHVLEASFFELIPGMN